MTTTRHLTRCHHYCCCHPSGRMAACCFFNLFLRHPPRLACCLYLRLLHSWRELNECCLFIEKKGMLKCLKPWSLEYVEACVAAVSKKTPAFLDCRISWRREAKQSMAHSWVRASRPASSSHSDGSPSDAKQSARGKGRRGLHAWRDSARGLGYYWFKLTQKLKAFHLNEKKGRRRRRKNGEKTSIVAFWHRQSHDERRFCRYLRDLNCRCSFCCWYQFWSILIWICPTGKSPIPRVFIQ